MGKIIHEYKDINSFYPSGVEFVLDSNEKITVGNSSAGIKIYGVVLFIIPKLLWRCDNASLISKMFPILEQNYVGSPLKQIALDIIERFKTKKELVFFLENYKT